MTELLVVVAVILILMALLIVSAESIYSQGMQVKCQHRLEQIGHVLHMYSSGNHGYWPPAWNRITGKSWYQVLLAHYLKDPAILACPSADQPPTTLVEGTPDQTEQREEADDVYKALRWLQSKQRPDGRFPTVGFYWPQSSTGLSLLAFFGFGCNDKHPPEFAATVRAAVEYLSSSDAQYKTGTERGRFKQDNEKIYNQGICVMALAAAAQIIEDPELRSRAAAAAQLGVDWMVAASDASDYGGFTYEVPYDAGSGGYVDTNATCWFYHGLAAARDSGLSVPQRVLDKASDANQGFFYWAYSAWDNGSAYYRFGIPNARKHFSGGQTNTAVLLATRLVMGQGPGADPCVSNAEYLYNNNQPSAKIIAMEPESLTYIIYFMNSAMTKMGGKYEQQWRANFFPENLMKTMLPDGEDMAYWPNTACHDIGGSWSARGEWGDCYATAMACLALEAGYSDYWLTVQGVPPIGQASYGYNNRLGKAPRTVAADTITVMDYVDWDIDHDDIDVEQNDTDADIAPRHSGRANALLGDGRVRSFEVDDITPGMWTLEAGD
jgi:prepilin-type processing-associated H-X9-DG protein